MRAFDWFKNHRIISVSLAAATAYFLFVPLSGFLYYEFDPKSFVVLHSIMEAFSIVVSFMCFGITLHSNKMAKNSQNMFLGVAFLSIGIIDIFHALSYLGMPDFVTQNTVDKATQLWVCARLVGAAAFLAAAFVPPRWQEGRALNPYPLILAGLAVPAAVFTWLVLLPGSLPAMFVPGEGLTPLKIWLEYAIVAAMTLAALLFYLRYVKTGESHLLYFIGAMALGVFSELFFTLYASPYDIYNFMGHAYKVAGYCFIYQMLFATSVVAPYEELANAKDVLREYSEHLEDMVVERTGELVETNRELERLNRLKDEFLAVCSHDMRSPLQSSILLIELLLDEVEGGLSEDQKQSLLAIRKNEAEQLELVTNLLDLARKEEGLRLNLSDVDAGKMIGEWAEKQRLIAGKKGIGFKVDAAGGIIWRLDAFKITQALNNLASNALKFTPPSGEIRLTAATDGPDGLLRVSMFNSGPAIPKSELGRIFDRFTQAGGGRDASKQGVGLGLSIARTNVKLHGGRIWAESEEGVGNTFTFTIPLSG